MFHDNATLELEDRSYVRSHSLQSPFQSFMAWCVLSQGSRWIPMFLYEILFM